MGGAARVRVALILLAAGLALAGCQPPPYRPPIPWQSAAAPPMSPIGVFFIVSSARIPPRLRGG